MNKSKKLELSKETLRCLDDRDLTDVVGGWHQGGGGGGGNRQSNVIGVCVSQQANSCVCLSDGCSNGICI